MNIIDIGIKFVKGERIISEEDVKTLFSRLLAYRLTLLAMYKNSTILICKSENCEEILLVNQHLLQKGEFITLKDGNRYAIINVISKTFPREKTKVNIDVNLQVIELFACV